MVGTMNRGAVCVADILVIMKKVMDHLQSDGHQKTGQQCLILWLCAITFSVTIWGHTTCPIIHSFLSIGLNIFIEKQSLSIDQTWSLNWTVEILHILVLSLNHDVRKCISMLLCETKTNTKHLKCTQKSISQALPFPV